MHDEVVLKILLMSCSNGISGSYGIKELHLLR